MQVVDILVLDVTVKASPILTFYGFIVLDKVMTADDVVENEYVSELSL